MILVLAQYSCSQRRAYAAVSIFSVLMFLAHLALTLLLYLWRADIIDESAGESSVGYYPRKSTGFLVNSTFTSLDGSVRVIPHNNFGTRRRHDDDDDGEFHGIRDAAVSVNLVCDDLDPAPTFYDGAMRDDIQPATTADL